jgi:hypothetical protein
MNEGTNGAYDGQAEGVGAFGGLCGRQDAEWHIAFQIIIKLGNGAFLKVCAKGADDC